MPHLPVVKISIRGAEENVQYALTRDLKGIQWQFVASDQYDRHGYKFTDSETEDVCRQIKTSIADGRSPEARPVS